MSGALAVCTAEGGLSLTRALLATIVLSLAATHAAQAPSLGVGASTRSKTVVSLGSRPPDRFPAGKTWSVIVTLWKRPVLCESPRLRISYPLVDLKPRLIIRNAATGEQRRFVARATAVLGDYRANVIFPSAGSWSYSVDDRHGVVWRFGSVSIAEPGPGPAAPDPRLRGSHPAVHILPGGKLYARLERVASRATLRAPFSVTFELWRLAECRRPRFQVEYPVTTARPEVRFRRRRNGRTISAAARNAQRQGSYVVKITLPERGTWDYSAVVGHGRPKRLGAVRVT